MWVPETIDSVSGKLRGSYDLFGGSRVLDWLQWLLTFTEVFLRVFVLK